MIEPVIALAVALAVAAAALAFAYNRLVAGRNRVRNGWSQIDVQLRRRHDLIPNLVETVRGSMAYEEETLRRVVEARGRAVSAASPAEAIGAEAGVSAALGCLLAVVEAHPELRAQDNVARLMEEFATTENRISFARQHYNDAAMDQNNRVEAFPSNLVARLFGFRAEAFFAIPEADAAAREAPGVRLR